MTAFMSRDCPASSVMTTAPKVPSSSALQSTVPPPPVVTRNTLPSSLVSLTLRPRWSRRYPRNR